MCRLFTSQQSYENDVEKADETKFIIDMDNGKTLGFTGDTEVKYDDVVLGGEGMKMLVRIGRGTDVKVQPPFKVFKNRDHNYPMKGISDDIKGVSYSTGPKGWTEKTVLPLWLQERMVMWKLLHNRKRMLCSQN